MSRAMLGQTLGRFDAEAFEELSKLRCGVGLDIPLRQAIEHGRD